MIISEMKRVIGKKEYAKCLINKREKSDAKYRFKFHTIIIGRSNRSFTRAQTRKYQRETQAKSLSMNFASYLSKNDASVATPMAMQVCRRFALNIGSFHYDDVIFAFISFDIP